MAWGLVHVFSGRAAYIHVGAMFGTIMTLNVWMRILPAQRKMIAAAAAGHDFDPALGAQAKLRSKHNTFMAVPVVFIMISNHFPVATYGNRYSWEILVTLVVVGWGAASRNTPGLRSESSANNRQRLQSARKKSSHDAASLPASAKMRAARGEHFFPRPCAIAIGKSRVG